MTAHSNARVSWGIRAAAIVGSMAFNALEDMGIPKP
jgi:hypothetical protein